MIFPAFAAVAERDPDQIALIDQRSRVVTFGQLHAAVGRSAASLQSLGLGRGSTVALFAPNRVEWVIASLATAAIGARSIGLNTRFRTSELDYLLHIGSADAVLAPDAFLGVRPAELLLGIRDSPMLLVDGDPSVFHDRFSPIPWGQVENSLGSGIRAGDDADLGLGAITDSSLTGDDRDAEWCGFTTSGTTGHPKLAVHSQAGSLHHFRAVIDAFDLGPTTVAFVPLPLCGVFGFTAAFATLLAGGTTVLHETFDPAAAATAIAEHGVTFANGADNMIDAIFDQPSFDWSKTTWTTGGFADFTNTGAAVVARADELTDGRLRLTGVYGSSEGFALMSRWPAGASVAQRAVNGGELVSPELEVRCVDPAAGTVLAHGEPGEIQFRGPGMITGYVEHPDAPETSEATAAAFTEDGWFRTGDLGSTLAERVFVYNARLGDSLRLRGFLCDPTEIEHHLERHPLVDLAQVVGVDRPGGEVAVAFVRPVPTPSPGLTDDAADHLANELLEHCATGLANYKTPARVVIVDEFPVTDGPNGVKIRKVDLRATATQWYLDADNSTKPTTVQPSKEQT